MLAGVSNWIALLTRESFLDSADLPSDGDLGEKTEKQEEPAGELRPAVTGSAVVGVAVLVVPAGDAGAQAACSS